MEYTMDQILDVFGPRSPLWSLCVGCCPAPTSTWTEDMGVAGSTARVVTLESDDGSTVVTISEAVAKRILGKETGVPAALDKEEIKSLPESSSGLNLEDFKTMEKYYQKRLKAVETQNDILRQTSEESFVSAVKEVEEKFLKQLPSCSVCEEFQDAITECYKNNKSATINCSKEVQAFKNCVQKHREATLGKRG